MAQFIVFLLVVLAIFGIVYFGWAKIVLMTLLVFVVATVVPCAIIGIRKGARLQREAREAVNAKPPEPAVDVTKFVLIPVEVFARWQRDNPAAAATIVAATASPVPEGDVPATDDELKRLREMAGLDEEGEADQ
jgi:hypothetical protein